MRILMWSACWILLCPSMSTQDPPTKPETQDDDYAIYSEVIGQKFVNERVDRIVVADRTLMGLPPVMMGMTQFGDSPQMQRIRESAANETLQDYEQKNKSSVALENKFSLKVSVVLISEVERDRIFLVSKGGKKGSPNPKGLDEFHRLYPNCQGFMTLSRIGFNPSKTQALLYVGNLCGGLCGSGQFFLLVKEGNSWKIQYVATKWVS